MNSTGEHLLHILKVNMERYIYHRITTGHVSDNILLNDLEDVITDIISDMEERGIIKKKYKNDFFGERFDLILERCHFKEENEGVKKCLACNIITTNDS